MKTLRLFSLLVILFVVSTVVAQAQSQRGTIITPASPAANPLDPNGDGFVNRFQTPFTNDGYYVDEFEYKMFGVPIIGTGDVSGDNQSGPNCGVTDIIPDSRGFSAYALRRPDPLNAAINNLIFRFRLGDNVNSTESFHILLDIDGLFGQGKDPNYTSANPGFEVEVTLIKSQNPGIYLYDIDGVSSCPTPFQYYPLSSNFQVAVGDLVTCGNPDFFYDFFIPFNRIAQEFGIDLNTELRFVASTSSAATCALSGPAADIAGIDNMNPSYLGKDEVAYTSLIDSQCPTPVANLCVTCPGFSPSLPPKPTISEPIRDGQTYLSGSTKSGSFIKVSIFARVGGTDAQPVWSTTPKEEVTVSSRGSFWSANLVQKIRAYDRVVARAQLNASGSGCGNFEQNTYSTAYAIAKPNSPPVAYPQTVSTLEDTPLNIVLTSSDVDNEPIDYCTIVTYPLHGVLTGIAPNLTYTPNPNYTGIDHFSYEVCDGIHYSNEATITINVQPVNDTPVAANSNVTVVEDTPTPLTLMGADVDGDALTYTVLTQPAHGTVSGTGASLTYTPNLNYTGPDSFTFKVNDGTVDSNTATVSITCTPVNDAPVASSQNVIVNEDASVGIVLVATDPDSNIFTYTIVTPPAHGTLTGTGANLTYTPAANYFGPDSFTYKANDGSADSNIATVSITVNPVNDAPVANNQNVIVLEDTATPITLTASDVDGDILTYIVLTQPSHGTLSGSGANLIYTPASNFTGADSFTFKVNDGTVDSDIATVSISIVRFSDAPVANNQSVTTNEDVSLPMILTGSDPDGDAITFSIVTTPAHGTLSGSGANVTYMPDPNYNGSDSFTFRTNDGILNSNIANVSITVNPINDAPVAFSLTVPYQLNTPKSFTISGTDVELGDLTASSNFIIVTQPANGALSGTAPNLVYTPNLNFNNADGFTFKVTDGSLESGVVTVTFVLDNLVNDAPVAANQNVTVIEDQSKNITLQATDADSDPITFTIITPPSHGTWSGTAPNVVYTPDANYTGPDSFSFRASDGSLNTVATVSITVVPVNDAPMAANQTVSVQEDIAKNITLVATDAEGETVTYTILTQPAHGVLSGTAPNLIYTPTSNYNGPDSFTFQVNDGTNNSNVATVSISVMPVNDAPVAVTDPIMTNEDTSVTFNVVLNDSDSDGTINAATVDLNPATPAIDNTFTVTDEGTYVVDNAGQVTFTPVLNYNGPASPVSYNVKDNIGATSNTVSIQVTVIPVNDAPVVQNKTVTINEDEATSICFTITDIENDPYVFTGAVSLDGHGTVTLDPTTGQLCFIFAPNQDYNGQDRVEVTVCDANNTTLCSKGIITIIIAPVNDPPVTVINSIPTPKITLTTAEDTPLNFCVDVTDQEGNTISSGTVTSISGGGSLVARAHGANQLCFTFTPAADFNGKAVLEVAICDNGDPTACGKLVVEVDVTPVNDAPVANSQSVTVTEDTPKVITLSATDADEDALTYTVLIVPLHGTISGTGAAITYTPDADYVGPDSFTFKANDGTVDSNTETVSINVTPVNDAPVISTIPTITTPEDTQVQICLGVSDADGDIITYNSPVNVSGGGTMTSSSAFYFCYTFMPAKDFNGDTFWKFSVCDNGNPGKCTEVTVKITVTPVNDAPVAVDDNLTAQSSVVITAANILANDTDVDNDALVLTITPVSGPYHGTVTLKADGKLEYKSNLDFMGIDSVRYRVCDTGTPTLCDEGLVIIEVLTAPFKIYNGLSPNGDNRNDYWRIDGIEAFPNNRVRVFDRFNNLIFETTGYNNEENNWRGQTNHSMISGNVPEGSYYYSVDLGDGSKLYSGYLVLKKN